jgi:hypothetical protein
VTLRVTIRNQGTADVSTDNNFFLDAYVNHVPTWYDRGNLAEWGVQWRDMAAGASKSFETTVTFSAPGDYWLYAQADTDRNVVEAREDNNVLGGCGEHRVQVTAATNAIPSDAQPAAPQTPAPALPPRPTPTPARP